MISEFLVLPTCILTYCYFPELEVVTPYPSRGHTTGHVSGYPRLQKNFPHFTPAETLVISREVFHTSYGSNRITGLQCGLLRVVILQVSKGGVQRRIRRWKISKTSWTQTVTHTGNVVSKNLEELSEMSSPDPTRKTEFCCRADLNSL